MPETCEACGTDCFESPCMDCIRARHRTVLNRGRCTCPKKLKRPRNIDTKIRAWVACDRCLGTIKQLR